MHLSLHFRPKNSCSEVKESAEYVVPLGDFRSSLGSSFQVPRSPVVSPLSKGEARICRAMADAPAGALASKAVPWSNITRTPWLSSVPISSTIVPVCRNKCKKFKWCWKALGFCFCKDYRSNIIVLYCFAIYNLIKPYKMSWVYTD